MTVIAACCGADLDYCECPDHVYWRATRAALARQDCPPAPKRPAEDYGEPPF